MADQTWVAHTRRLDRDLDLLDVAGDDGVLFLHEGRGLAGRGTVARIDVPMDRPHAAAEAWHRFVDEQVVLDDEVALPGTGPVALAALPFDPSGTGTLEVPSDVVGRSEDGTRWVTWLRRRDDTSTPDPGAVVDALARSGARSASDPGRISVRSVRPPAEWMDALVAGRERIRAGELRKFVLAREVVVETEHPLARRSVLGRLRAAYPTCFITSVGSMVGASPELLVSRRGDIVRSRPLAGTAPRSPDPVVDARLAAGLLASAKNREEHQIVIDMVHETLLPWCSYLDAEPEPSVIGMANVQHLATYLEGRLSLPAASALEMAIALHPTPAICGTPTDLALQVIRELEGLERGSYAGPVGWVDAHGNGDWVVGIRSAELGDRSARVVAGVGVVADSDPDAELDETRNKLQAMLSALLRP